VRRKRAKQTKPKQNALLARHPALRKTRDPADEPMTWPMKLRCALQLEIGLSDGCLHKENEDLTTKE
jgi:hypothetical protein